MLSSISFHPLFFVSVFIISGTRTDVVATTPFFLPDNPYEEPPRNAQRSPCPFINALANHGYINRSGKDVDIFELADIMTDIFDVSSTVTTGIANAVVSRGLTKSSKSRGTELLDIDDLHLHGFIEHDASHARVDDFFGPEASKPPNDMLIDNLLATAGDCPVVTIEDMKKHQRNRIIDGRMNNPEFNITGQVGGLAGQTVFLLTLGSQHDLGFVTKDRLDTLLRMEKIPDDYQPGKQRDPNFVPWDFSEGSLGASVRAEFLENVNAALAEEIEMPAPVPTPTPKSPKTSKSSKSPKKQMKMMKRGMKMKDFLYW